MPGPTGAAQGATERSARVPGRSLQSAAEVRGAIAVVLLSLLIAAIFSDGLPGRGAPVPAPARHGARADNRFSLLPVAAQGPVSATLGAADPAYRIAGTAGLLRVENPAQRLRAAFTRSGAQVGAGDTRLGLSLRAVGFGAALRPLAETTPGATGNRVEYARGGVAEWYVNGPLGLEQGFTLGAPPGAPADGPLTLSLALSGNVSASLGAGRRSLALDHPGSRSLSYGSLLATDARGRVLRSWMQLSGGEVLLRVDARGARYPLRIDPLLQEGEALPGEAVEPNAHFGLSVALSADGNTALVGAPDGFGSGGAAWVFVRSGTTWKQQHKFTGPESGPLPCGEETEPEGEECRFGWSVALSADGNTALVGDPAVGEQDGAVWTFIRAGLTWTQHGPPLTALKEEGPGHFGWAVSLSAEGSVALIGGPGDHRERGAAWVATRQVSGWSQAPKLTTEQEIGTGRFGRSVALSSDGETALIGAFQDNNGQGAAWIYTGSGASWSQGPRLLGAGESGPGHFGASVALSGAGTTATALIGGPADEGERGAAWTFSRAGSTWSQLGAKLTGAQESGAAQFGRSVALSADGSTALVGGPRDATGLGAAWAFAWSGTEWSPPEGLRLTALESEPRGWFGGGVALSADGKTALIGGPHENTRTGYAWVFQDGSVPAGVTSVEPESGPTTGHTKVTIWGSGFIPGDTVTIGSQAAAVHVVSEEEITAETHATAAGSYQVVVSDAGGPSTGGPSFTYIQVPTKVMSIEPESGPTGGHTKVTIRGSGFVPGDTVKIGEPAGAVKVVSEGVITAETQPTAVGSYEVVVTSEGVPSTGGPSFTFYEGAPPKQGHEPEGQGSSGNTSGNSVQTAGASSGTLGSTSANIPPPTLAVTGNVAPVSGHVYVKLPGSKVWVSLTGLRQVPFGTIINATHGSVIVTTMGPHGKLQTITFSAGVFRLTQNRKALVTATLVGGNFAVCPTAKQRAHLATAASKHASGKHVVRKLWAQGHGSYSTKGNYATGAVLGTKWLTEDRCNGTLIYVATDRVAVRNLVNHRLTVVKAHHSIVAKAP